MTTPAGDEAVEQAFEACLAGRPVPSAEYRLVAFSDAVRASATAPGRPSAALADLLANGLLVDQSSPSDATARSARRAPARGRTRRLRMLGPAMFAKFLSAGVAAKAATVAGVVVVGVGTAGFTGELPTHVQQTFATVVDHATPFSAPTPKGESDEETSTDPTGTSTDTTDDSTDAMDSSTSDSSTAGAGQDTKGDDSQGDGTQETRTDGSDSQGDDAQGGDTQDGGTPVVAQHPTHPDNYGAEVSADAHLRNQVRQSAAQASKVAHHQNGDDQNQATSGDDNSQGDNTQGDNAGSVSGSDDSGNGDPAQRAGGSSLEDSSQGGVSHGGSQHGRGHGSNG